MPKRPSALAFEVIGFGRVTVMPASSHARIGGLQGMPWYVIRQHHHRGAAVPDEVTRHPVQEIGLHCVQVVRRTRDDPRPEGIAATAARRSSRGTTSGCAAKADSNSRRLIAPSSLRRLREEARRGSCHSPGAATETLQVRTRLAAGGDGIRTLGPPTSPAKVGDDEPQVICAREALNSAPSR